MTPPDLDAIREGVLAQMERHERSVKLGILAAELAEAVMLGMAIWLVDFSSRFEILVLVLAVLSYTIIAFGLLALGAHVSRVGDRILAALPAADRGGRL